MKSLKRVAVTGGAGQIAYSLLFRIASGEMLGRDQPIALHILDLPHGMEALKGVVMELQDCAFPLLKEIHIGSDPHEVFEGVHYALLVGSKPRGPGMERKELLTENGAIFVEQGKALSSKASPDVLVFVVGNPCNTNCLIAMNNAPNIPPEQFFAMTRLDHNRARFQLAHKAGVPLLSVDKLCIWGNHSSTQVPDFVNATIDGKCVDQVIDRSWLEGEFFETVQKRGAAVIAARGKSSAASATQAIIDSIRSILFGADDERYFSVAIPSDGNPYGIKPGLIFSFPCTLSKGGKTEIVHGLVWDEFLRKKIASTEKELLEERELVKHLLG